MASTTLHWLPAADDVPGELRRALDEPSADARANALINLAQRRSSYLESVQFGHVIGRCETDLAGRLPEVRLAILSSATTDHLVPAVRVAGLRHRLLVKIHRSPFGQYRQELLSPSDELRLFKPNTLLLSLAARETLSGIPLHADHATAEGALTAAIDEMRALWRRGREIFGATVIQQTFLNTSEPLFGSFERQVPGAPCRLTVRLNELLCEAAAADGVLVLDVARQAERDGLDAWYDVVRWLQAKMEIAPPAAPMYGELLARLLAAARGSSRKCLVLDLDNTLWGGVVGDDGPDGIVLGEGSGPGEAHLALQRHARLLRDRGVILAVCSKNDPAIAESVVRDHPEMLLRPADFAAFVANWDDKAKNLQRIATQLNIGVDSLVFVDDNPVERARVRQSLPMVAVPELPDDAAGYVRTLADAGYFEAVAFTAEDRERGEQYAANVARESLQGASESIEDFLQSLGMVAQCRPFQAADLPRITQLINKTNQFNPTTRRYSAHEVDALLRDAVALTLQCRLADRFGDNGLVAAMILTPVSGAGDRLAIDTWVMSCRVFGRQLEHETMNAAAEAAIRRGARYLEAMYAPTAKNGVVASLYPSLGFVPDRRHDACDGSTHWLLDLSSYRPVPTFITRSLAHD